jgi:hypothetical protein
MSTIREHQGAPPVLDGVRIIHRFNFLGSGFCVLVFVLFLLCPMLTVSLASPFLIALLVLSSVYL